MFPLSRIQRQCMMISTYDVCMSGKSDEVFFFHPIQFIAQQTCLGNIQMTNQQTPV